MATLVLTAVGTAIGGPIGASIGSIIGQAIDARWLSPGGREGPRLADLRVQTSSYGTAIPRLYGRMRVAGTVIWSTDLIEQRQRRSAGKGQPKTTTYSYSASFAVALSSRSIVAVHRIWADGNILRGADGAFVEQTGFRVHMGGEDQAVDPLIAAAEGPGSAPAYRGIAYVVFEELDLSAFGNRIPSLTFEVEADGAAITLARPAEDVLEDVLVAGAPAMGGYALNGGSRRQAMAPLTAVLLLSRSSDGGWRMGSAGDVPMVLSEPASVTGSATPERRNGAADRLPREIALAHFDPARDFQTSVQMAALSGGGGAAVELDLPLAAEAGAARALAEREAANLRAGQLGVSWPGGLAALAVRPGDMVLADGVKLSVQERRIEGGVANLGLRGVAGATLASFAADGGRAVNSPDLQSGETVAALFDLPVLVPGDVDQVRLVLAAGGTGAGWRRAGVTLTPGPGAAASGIGTVQAAAVIGSVSAVGGTGTAVLFDDASWIEVTLARDDMVLSNADDGDLLSGANAGLAGNELFQFGHAEPLGARRWRLTRLLRGRRGSGVTATLGAPFTLLDDPALLAVGDAALVPQLGGAVMIGATGAAAALSVPITAAGRAQQPLPPVHLTAGWQADGGLTLQWVRRSRTGFDWRDGVDAPVDAGNEAYRLTLTAGAISLSVDTPNPAWTVPAADIAQWRGAGVTMVTVAVVQIGAMALSEPAVRTFSV